MWLQGQATGSVREAPKREKTPKKRGMTVIRKTQRREGQFWHRRYRTELSGTGGKPGQPVKASLLVSSCSWFRCAHQVSAQVSLMRVTDTPKQKSERKSVRKQC